MLYGEEKPNRFTLRTYHSSEDQLSYDNLYLMYRIQYSPLENISTNLTLVKGYGEGGCFPRGYVKESDHGLYENGSYYILIEKFKGFQKIILGNYMPRLGQGLLFGGSYPLILYNPYYDLARYRDGIYPTSSTSKSVILEGLAIDYEIAGLSIRPFFSWNRYDCSAGESDYYKYNDNDYDDIPNDEDSDDFTGIIDGFPDGYSCKNHLKSCIRDDADYGDESDREKRNNLAEYIGGLNLSSKTETLKIGGSLYYTQYNRLIDPYYNFKPGEGDKTSYYFRGKNSFSSNLYFKLYEPVEFFGEVAGIFYHRRSYYTEFNGDYISSVGIAGGVRKKFGKTGLILWGAYVPATFVNPHGVEFPDGLNNFAGGLFGMYHLSGPNRFIHWVYTYGELATDDGSDNIERGISYNQRIEIPLFEIFRVKIRQNLELIDHHYYEPDSVSVKITSKNSLIHEFSRGLESRVTLENRIGGPVGQNIYSGVSFSGELLYKKEQNSGSISLTYYYSAENRFAYLYPYERSLYNWSFISYALHGNGIAGSLLYIRNLKPNVVLGTKLRYQFDIIEKGRRVATLYLMSQIPF
jgi:hypothetical protein